MQSINRFFPVLLLFSMMSCMHQVDEVHVAEVIASELIEVPKDQLILHANEGKMYHQNQLFSGYSVEYYPNSQLANKVAYLYGKKHGLVQKWYKDSILAYEANYTANKLDGLARSWWSNGVLRSESRFSNAVAHGIQKQWYRSGALFKEIHLRQGKEEGLQRAWRENGKIYINYEAKNGRIFGLKRSNLCFQLTEEKIQYEE